jgi:hypothetical protein
MQKDSKSIDDTYFCYLLIIPFAVSQFATEFLARIDFSEFGK